MSNHPDYQLALLYLMHLVVGADDEIDEQEMNALKVIRKKVNISEETFEQFTSDITTMRERDIYINGLELLNNCSEKEKIDAFALLYKLTEADGKVHIKEVRFLLYASKSCGINFDDVTTESKKISLDFN
jgi:uncharacterized tellurite resistance protein B-like protein